MPGSDETFASYGIGWANLSNTPFRKYKTLQFEGGTASPLIVHSLPSSISLKAAPLGIATSCLHALPVDSSWVSAAKACGSTHGSFLGAERGA